MKKILMICMVGLLGAMPAHATTMCAADDTLPIVLDPAIAGFSHLTKEELFEWLVDFPYGTIFGIGTCVSTPSSTPVEPLIDTGTGDIAIGGERLGQYCWCKMTHPVNSRWVYTRDYITVAECKSRCMLACAYGLRDSLTSRISVFGSVVD